MTEPELEGVWSYAAFEVNGLARSERQLAHMANLVLLPGDHLPGWSGLWAAVTCGYEGGSWSDAEIEANCRHIIVGTEGEVWEAPRSDFYFYAGGRYRVASGTSPRAIDFEQFCRGAVLPSSQLGIYFLAEGRLTLCLSDSGRPRPSKFGSGDYPYQSLGELVRRSPKANNEGL